MFSRYCVVSTDSTNRVLDVKHYSDLKDYNKEIDIMHSAFETRKDAVHECRGVAKAMNGFAEYEKLEITQDQVREMSRLYQQK